MGEKLTLVDFFSIECRKGDSEKVNFLHDNIADNLTFQEYCKKVMNRHSISCLISQAQYGARKDQMNTSKGQKFLVFRGQQESICQFSLRNAPDGGRPGIEL